MQLLSLSALADPTRRRIVEMLAVKDRTAGEIVGEFEMSAPAISQHLKRLKEAKLVQVRTSGQHRIHSLDPTGLKEMETWLARTRRFWAQRLDALERELEAEDAREKKGRKGR